MKRKKKILNIKKFSYGESLLEITISIGIALIIASGLVISTVNGLRNSQFSKNQIQATKFAQEGVDRVKAIRDRNCPVIVGGTSYLWFNDAVTTQPLVWNVPASVISQDPLMPTNFQASLTTTTCELRQDTAAETITNSSFTRKILIFKNASTSSLQVTVDVAWNDASGAHSSKLVTILTNY